MQPWENWNGYPKLVIGQKIVCHNEKGINGFMEGVPYVVCDVVPEYYRIDTGSSMYSCLMSEFHCHFQPVSEVEYTILVNQQLLLNRILRNG